MRAAGLKVGFYLSAADWYHPDYPDPFARDWPLSWPDEAARQRFVAHLRAQLEELLTNYGPVDVLWWDGCEPKPMDGAELNALARRLQPDILISERNGEPSDFDICEQAIKPGPPGRPWEACLTLNDSWGFHAGDENWKTAGQVLALLTQTAAGGGNLLLNVGPHADGTIPEPSQRILREVGGWLARNSQSIRGSDRSPFTWTNWGRTTTRGRTVYLHVFHGTGAELCFAEIKNRVLTARFLGTGEPVAFEQRPAAADNGRLFLRGLPTPLPEAPGLPTVIALELDGEPAALQAQTSFWIPG